MNYAVEGCRSIGRRSNYRMAGKQESSNWTFFTNHGHVLMCLSRNNRLRLRDMAALIGITERAVHKIITDLENAGIITRHRSGRCNEYEITVNKPLRHPLEAHCTVGELIDLVKEHEDAPPQLPLPEA